MDGTITKVGGKVFDSPGYDLLGLITGSEGLLCVITEVTVKILKKPDTVKAILLGFPTIEDGGNCVTKIISEGIIPSGMEMMDNPAINAAEDFVHAGYPRDVEALLITELDGPDIEVDYLCDSVSKIAAQAGAVFTKSSANEEERQLFWSGRKAAFGAVGRISPDYFCMDGTIPRGRLAQVLRQIQDWSAKYDLAVANVFHAGDGNIHPLILYDEREPDQVKRALQAGNDILGKCIELGGSVTGEHGIGFPELDMGGGVSPSQVIVVHAGQIVVIQRVGMKNLQCTGAVHDILHAAAYRFCGRDAERRADAFAAPQGRISHGLVKNGGSFPGRRQMPAEVLIHQVAPFV